MKTIFNTFWIAKDGDGSQFEYKEEPRWTPLEKGYNGKPLMPADFGFDIDTQDNLKAGDKVKATLSLTFAEHEERTVFTMEDK